MPDLNDDVRDEPLMATVSFTEWLGMKEELNRLTRELTQARNEINMRPHATEWHRLHDRLAQLKDALEEIRDTVCVARGEERAMIARFHEIARVALAPCSRES